MKLIERQELKSMIDGGETFKLVMVLNEWAFNAKRIPGSIHVGAPFHIAERLDPTDEIVIYCSDRSCGASQAAYVELERAGFRHVRRYAGGIADWETAGYPLEGEFVDAGQAAAT